MPLTSIIHGYVSHQIDGTTFPAFSLWKAAEWVAQLTHRLNLPRSPLLATVQHYCKYIELFSGFIAILTTRHLHVKRYENDLHTDQTKMKNLSLTSVNLVILTSCRPPEFLAVTLAALFSLSDILLTILLL